MKRPLSERFFEAIGYFISEYPFWCLLAFILFMVVMDFYHRFYKIVRNTDEVDMMHRYINLQMRKRYEPRLRPK